MNEIYENEILKTIKKSYENGYEKGLYVGIILSGFSIFSTSLAIYYSQRNLK